MSNQTASTSSIPAAVQNESYLFDLVGSLTQRRNNAPGSPENFFYDDLYRPDYSTLNNGTTTSRNLDPSYDLSGQMQTKE